jgi:hypothetical protein
MYKIVYGRRTDSTLLRYAMLGSILSEPAGV